MKILFFTHNLHYEGAPNVLYQLAKKIHAKREYEAVILSMRDGPARTMLTGSGISTQIVDQAPWSFPEIIQTTETVFSHYLTNLEDKIRSISPDLLFVNVLHSFFSVNVAQRLEIPTVWLIHESYTTEEYLRLLPEFQHENLKNAFRNAHHVVFCASALPSLYKTCLTRNNFHVVHPVIPPEFSTTYGNIGLRNFYRKRFNVPEDGLMFINVGASELHKNQELILKAAKRLNQNTIRFFLIGGNPDSSYRLSLQELITTSRVQANVTIVDQVDEVTPYYLAADAFVLSSTWDTYPLVILEAMAFGLPIITTSLAGVWEQVQLGFNATETANDPDELAGHISRLAFDADLRHEMGKNSRTVYESLGTHASMVNRYERLFQEVNQK